jgi:hypothetical protein
MCSNLSGKYKGRATLEIFGQGENRLERNISETGFKECGFISSGSKESRSEMVGIE